MVEAKFISKETTLGEVVQKYPETIEILLNNGLHCIGCHVSYFETIEQGASAHGLNEKQIEEMVEEMNKAIESKSK